MPLELLLTDDGSYTLYSSDFQEIYHSRQGALTESMHVFIKAGLEFVLGKHKHIELLEVGFGTGLNALLSLQVIKNLDDIRINYHGIEPILPPYAMVEALAYPCQLDDFSLEKDFKAIHQCPPFEMRTIKENFAFRLLPIPFEQFMGDRAFNLIFYDAFAPSHHEAMWQPIVFEKITQWLAPEAVLVTYCAKGVFKRMLKELGFHIESLPGPGRKREMTRAIWIGNGKK